jgi:hypothetical protein
MDMNKDQLQERLTLDYDLKEAAFLVGIDEEIIELVAEQLNYLSREELVKLTQTIKLKDKR